MRDTHYSDQRFVPSGRRVPRTIAIARLVEKIKIIIRSPHISERIVWALRPISQSELRTLEDATGPAAFSSLHVVSGVEQLEALLQRIGVTP